MAVGSRGGRCSFSSTAPAETTRTGNTNTGTSTQISTSSRRPPGHGQSEGKGEQEVAKYVEWMRKLIESLKLPKPVLIGHSLGAAVSLTFAARYGSLISGIIPVGGGVKMPVNSLILDGIKKDTASVISLIVKFAVAKENRERLAECLTKGLSAADPEVMYGDFLSCNRLDSTEEISRIRVPPLLVCGEDDK